jgi:hypothetical protein
LSAAVKNVNISFYGLSLLLVFANSLVVAVKFRVLARDTGNRQTVADLFRINLLCRFYSTFLTTAVGQGLLRWHFSSKGDADRLAYVAVMAVERFTFLFALLLTVAVSMLFVTDPWIVANQNLLVGIPVLGCAILLVVFLLLGHTSIPEKLGAGLPETSRPQIRFIFDPLSRLVRSFSLFQGKSGQVWASVGLSFVWQFFFVLRVYLLAVAMSLPFGLMDIGWMASFVLFIQVLPVSFNGLGLRETAYAQLFAFQGASPESGVVLGLLLFSHVLVMATCGGIIQLFSKSS